MITAKNLYLSLEAASKKRTCWACKKELRRFYIKFEYVATSIMTHLNISLYDSKP